MLLHRPLGMFEALATMLKSPYFPFFFLFAFRYLRTLIHLFSFWILYKPAALSPKPAYQPSDCTVILPTIDPDNVDMVECLRSCILNCPASIIIVTVGEENVQKCQRVVAPYREYFPSTDILVLSCSVANKRRQIAHALPHVTTQIIVLLDDHVFWPSTNFLPTVLAPFEDERVGGVGTNKRVRRSKTGISMKSFWNMLGAIYLERHNFEIRATNAIDGGVFVISGRTAIYRAAIMKDPAFINAYTDEKFFFGIFGPLNADDDNFITRWLVNHGYKIKIQYCNDALIETTLGTYPKFLSQCLRWVRTTWRSSSTSLFRDGTVWYRQPWCVYAVHVSSFFNFALFYDCALVYTLGLCPFHSTNLLMCLVAWIFLTKMIKLLPYFLRHPEDLLMLPGYFLFAYYHSFIKLYALLTFFNDSWGGRDLKNLDKGNNEHLNPDNGNGNDRMRNSDVFHHSRSLWSFVQLGPSQVFDSLYDLFYQRSATKPVSHSAMEKDKMNRPEQRKRRSAHRNRYPYQTPWGVVSPSNPHTKSANLLENDFASNTDKIQDASRSSSPTSKNKLTHTNVGQHYKTLSNHETVSRAQLDDSLTSAPRITRDPDKTTQICILKDVPTKRTQASAHQGAANMSLRTAAPSSTQSANLAPAKIKPVIKSTAPSNRTSKTSHTASSTISNPQTRTRKSMTENKNLTASTITSTTARNQITYKRTWTRGQQCDRLHYEGGKFNRPNNICIVEDVFNLPSVVIPGRPRM